MSVLSLMVTVIWYQWCGWIHVKFNWIYMMYVSTWCMFHHTPWASLNYDGILPLIHWGWDKMADYSQTTFSNAFSWMKIYEFRLIFHWILFLRVKLTIFQHLVQIMAWCRSGGKPLSESMIVCLLTHICVLISLNELNYCPLGDVCGCDFKCVNFKHLRENYPGLNARWISLMASQHQFR